MFKDGKLTKGAIPAEFDEEAMTEFNQMAIRFRSDNVFEVSYGTEKDESLRYKIDDAKNRLIIYDPADSTYEEDWEIVEDSVYSDSFEMEMAYDIDGVNKEIIRLKILTKK